ncbi:MAG: helicase C-terminal domain-containing protein [Thermomicrobiales bacterium]
MSNTVYVALDLEATEMHPERGEIIELGAIKFTTEKVLDRWSATVRPRGPVPFGITQLTGITQAEARRAAPFSAVVPALTAFLRNHPIVGQSVWLDVEMLRAAGLVLANPLFDTFELATLTLPGLPAYSLQQIARRLKVELPVEHRALADATVTVEVFRRLVERLLEFDPETIGEIGKLLVEAKSPVAPLVRDLAREKTREGFDSPVGALGAALKQQLAPRALTEDRSMDALFLVPRPRPERLEPTGRTRPIDLGGLRALFAPDGAFARAFPGYEYRSGQLKMMETVAGALNDGGIVVGEAGTGTGKSISYLIPSIIHASERGETVVISTATIGLQDQLFRKDIPDVARVLGEITKERKGEGANGRTGERAAAKTDVAPIPEGFRAALLKGRSNYLCLRRWFQLRRSPQHAQDDAHLLAKTMVWLQETDSGDRAELLLLPEEQGAWNRLAEHEGSCVASECVFQKRGQCYLYRARRQAEGAHVIVVNHALLLSDLGTDGGILPPYQHLVIDEAHHLEAEATRQLGFELDTARLANHLEAIRPAAGGATRAATRAPAAAPAGVLAEVRARLNIAKGAAAREAKGKIDEIVEPVWRATDEAREAGIRFFAHLANFVAKHGGEAGSYDQRLRLIESLRTGDDWNDVELAWESLHGPLLRIAEGLTTTLLALDNVGDELDGREDLLMELTLAQRVNAELRLHGTSAVGRPDPNMVYWIAAGSGNERITLHAAPLHVGPTLATQLFDQKRTVVLASATLATEGSFDFVRDRLGLVGDGRDERVSELRVPSPFDYRRNALLYLADDIPEPGTQGYQKALNDALIGLCGATEGRALLLFTSYSALQTTYRAIKGPLERQGILVLGQRLDGNPRQLLDRFRANPRAVILGAASFWEGVDVVGDALSVLAITRLPFAVPTDPVFAARSEGFGDPFAEYSVPHAILRFKQGFGRLIRSATDRGVCAILDRRVLSKRYGRGFIDSLPPCAEIRGPIAELGTAAADWLAEPPR